MGFRSEAQRQALKKAHAGSRMWWARMSPEEKARRVRAGGAGYAAAIKRGMPSNGSFKKFRPIWGLSFGEMRQLWALEQEMRRLTWRGNQRLVRARRAREAAELRGWNAGAGWLA
jgi:hypothetical protein